MRPWQKASAEIPLISNAKKVASECRCGPTRSAGVTSSSTKASTSNNRTGPIASIARRPLFRANMASPTIRLRPSLRYFLRVAANLIYGGARSVHPGLHCGEAHAKSPQASALASLPLRAGRRYSVKISGDIIVETTEAASMALIATIKPHMPIVTIRVIVHLCMPCLVRRNEPIQPAKRTPPTLRRCCPYSPATRSDPSSIHA